MLKACLLYLITFLSSFLLFQIELIIAKVLLPTYGGSYLVWGGCIVFFQATLLLGYVYSHLVIKKFGIHRYRLYHILLSLVPLLFFPGRPLMIHKGQYSIPLVIDVFGQLVFSIGPVFFILSTISLVYQSWLAQSTLPQKTNPYFLFATSNLGSFAALLTYPFLFEVFLDLPAQIQIWGLLYGVFFGLQILAYPLIPTKPKEEREQTKETSFRSKEFWYWFLLGAAATVMFLSVTHVITLEIAPLPLLWVLPLSIYLLSFVLNYKKNPWCPPWIVERYDMTFALSIILFFITHKRILPVMISLICYCILLFSICMFCQYHLYQTKPKRMEDLTWYYVIISTGSFLGGVLVTWVMPLVSTMLIEFLVGLFIISVVLVVGKPLTVLGFSNIRLTIYIVVLLMLWPLVFKEYNFFGLLGLVLIFSYIFSQFKLKPFVLSFMILAIVILCQPLQLLWAQIPIVHQQRNYYGLYTITESSSVRYFVSGTTNQGGQFLDEKRHNHPIAYYHPKSVIGQFMTSDQFQFKNIGMIGLGPGALAAYAKDYQSIEFFELDPDVFKLANKYFTYLRNSEAKIHITYGDARINLDKIPPKSFDLLIVDAFNGDSIPIHLLTVQALKKYKEYIQDKGIILFHSSNRHLDLLPVFKSNAKVVGAYCSGNANGFAEDFLFFSEWVAYTWDKEVHDKFLQQLKWYNLENIQAIKWIRPWSDEYSNILSIVKLHYVVDSIKNFMPFYW